MELEGTTILSGTWQAVPKSQWPDNTEALGIYEVALKTTAGQEATWQGFVINSNNQGAYAMGLFYGSDLGLYFDRTA